ncbi:MAG: 1-acyl-sn-glycerol-3-phosphate acyltransferase [Clostridia bacterium]|nr:1-acyl-sn-glycerol-3-phosphate acyltransferase [Clostridia bacterium]
MIFVICFAIMFLPLTILFPMRVKGKKNLPKKQGYVLTCNHYSNMDPVMLDVKLVKKLRFLAKKELFKNKFVGFFLKKFGAHPVDRGASDIKAFKFALETLKNKKPLGIFPEGTRNKTESEEMQEIKSGAIVFASKAGVPIVPAALSRPIKFLRFSTLIIGEPFFVKGENPSRLTKEEIEENVKILTQKTNELRENYKNIKENNKKIKK